MPQYAVIGRHEANGCPMTSKATREAAQRASGGLEELLKQEHAKLLLNLHLDPAHKVFWLFEAPTADTVRDILVDAGLSSFFDLEFHLVTPYAEFLKTADKFPAIYP
jgi:DNA primase